MKSTLIIVTGLPGTGKTSLAQFLSEELNLPFVSKDRVKELLFDSLGWNDREWSKKVGHATYGILDYFVEEELKVGHSLILESNFKPEFDNEKFRQWQNKYDYRSVQVICYAEGDVLYERFKFRALSGERHPGHDDANNLEEFKDTLAKGRTDPLAIYGHTLEINTTDFSSVDYSKILTEIKNLIS